MKESLKGVTNYIEKNKKHIKTSNTGTEYHKEWD